MEGYLHTILSSREVLPFSDTLTLAYQSPYTLGQEQPPLYARLVYSSIYGIPPISHASSKGSKLQTRRHLARQALDHGPRHVGYMADEGRAGDWTNTNEMPN